MVSIEERQFLAGELTSAEYIRLGQERSEELIRTHAPQTRERRVSSIEVFALVASTVYAATAAVFVFAQSTTAAVAAAVVSIGFIAIVNLLKYIHSDKRPWRVVGTAPMERAGEVRPFVWKVTGSARIGGAAGSYGGRWAELALRNSLRAQRAHAVVLAVYDYPFL